MVVSFKKYEQYKPSGVEWLGEVPKHWELIKFKYIFTEINERSNDGSEELLSVSQYTGVTLKKDKIEEGGLLTNAETLEGYKKVCINDLVSNIMLAWNGSLGFSPYNGITSPAYSVYRLKGINIPQYFHYLLRTETYKSEFKRNSSGVIESRLRLYSDDFFRIISLQPPLNEQIAIAEFLDRKTVQIDAAIAQKQQMIALLKERRQILIHRAVTQGLDPSVKMKDSGVEWIGVVPEHWNLFKVKNVFRLIIEPASKNNNHELLSVYTDIGVKPRKDLEERGNKASSTDGYWIVKKGDIVVNKLLAWMGAIGISEYDGVTSPAYDILRSTRPIDGYFYHNLFRTSICVSELKKYSRGIMDMRLRLYFDKFGDVIVPYPPIKEQTEIVERIKIFTQKIDLAINLKEQEIEKLKEYKGSLINSVVTGKVRVME
jgi:type I restriction enzyme, S subunit